VRYGLTSSTTTACGAAAPGAHLLEGHLVATFLRFYSLRPQAEIEELLARQEAEPGQRPGQRAIAAEVGRDVVSVHGVLRALVHEGYVEREPNVARGYSIRTPDRCLREMPFTGRIPVLGTLTARDGRDGVVLRNAGCGDRGTA
jgi:hypothetical protein